MVENLVVFFPCSDIAATSRFYQEVCGLPKVQEQAGGKLHIMKKAKPAHVLRFRIPLAAPSPPVRLVCASRSTAPTKRTWMPTISAC